MPVGHDVLACWAFTIPNENKTAVAKTAVIRKYLIFMTLT
jgi:hypothetical protein